MSRFERVRKIAERIQGRKKEAGKIVKTEEKEFERKVAAKTEVKRPEAKANVRRFAMGKQLRDKRIAAERHLAFLKKKGEDVKSITQTHQTTNRMETKDSNFSNGTDAGPKGTQFKNFDQLKKQQFDNATPTLFAEDTRKAYKRAIAIAYAKTNANRYKGQHHLKASLFDKFVEMGMTEKKAQIAIEAAFEDSAKPFLASVLKRADEVAEYGDETIAEIEAELEESVDSYIVVPADEVEIVSGEEIEEALEGQKEERIDEEAEEIEERVKEGSFKLPRVASSKKSSLLSQAVPGYKVPGN